MDYIVGEREIPIIFRDDQALDAKRNNILMKVGCSLVGIHDEDEAKKFAKAFENAYSTEEEQFVTDGLRAKLDELHTYSGLSIPKFGNILGVVFELANLQDENEISWGIEKFVSECQLTPSASYLLRRDHQIS